MPHASLRSLCWRGSQARLALSAVCWFICRVQVSWWCLLCVFVLCVDHVSAMPPAPTYRLIVAQLALALAHVCVQGLCAPI
jgi:hypothetical protein